MSGTKFDSVRGSASMRQFILPFLGCLSAVALGTVPAAADDNGAPVAGKEIVFDLGVGGRLQPKYDGAESYLLVPFPIFQMSYLRIPGLGTLSDASTKGVFFYPAFGFVGARDDSDDADLTGIDDVDLAFEFGAGLGYRTDQFRAFAEVRRGFNGHEGFVGELGVDAIFYPMDKVTLRMGPRLGFADEEYMDTYFSVSAAEALASGLSQFDAGGGIKDVGVVATASYAWTENTTLHLEGGYRRLIGDAADSPIVKRGSEDQFSVGLGVSYRFAFDLDGE